ncbi:MAG: hypothetical protein ACOC00_08670 [Halothiobacillaceae bacterium]
MGGSRRFEINPAIRLPEVLAHEDYRGNLATRPWPIREAIAEDLLRWNLARQWYESDSIKANQRRLAQLTPDHVQADMKRRMNRIHARHQAEATEPAPEDLLAEDEAVASSGPGPGR